MRFNRWPIAALVGALALMVSACGSDSAQSSMEVPEQLVGEWQLTSFRPPGADLAPAGPETFDARMTLRSDGMFERVEWREDGTVEDSGFYLVDGTSLVLVSYKDGAHTAERVDEGTWAVKDGMMTFALPDGERWRLLVFEPSTG